VARWTDIARWVGPTQNCTEDGMSSDVRGCVEHIASGSFLGTIAWQRNPDANVSSHFIVSRAGEIVQMVDTDDASWAQKDGNGTWLSIENEGRTSGDPGYQPGLERLTDAQVDANARIFAKAHQVYGAKKVPLQLAASPAGRGLGHHSMGYEAGQNWGHEFCPGQTIKSQKPAILARAIQIVNGDEDDVANTWSQPLTQGTPGYAGQQRDTALAFAWQASNEAAQGVNKLLAAAEADEVRDKAVMAAIQNLAIASGLDPTPILAAVAEVRDEARARFAQLADQHAAEMTARAQEHAAELAGLRAQLAALGG